jgi:hypothetical protein
MLWHGRSGNARGGRRMKLPPDASITRPATTPPTKAESERPSVAYRTPEKGSAVILVDRQYSVFGWHGQAKRGHAGVKTCRRPPAAGFGPASPDLRHGTLDPKTQP